MTPEPDPNPTFDTRTHHYSQRTLRFFNSQYIKVCSFLFVADPPVIKEAPMSQKVKAGGIAAFICIATGDPLPNITWRKDKKSIPQRYVYINV